MISLHDSRTTSAAPHIESSITVLHNTAIHWLHLEKKGEKVDPLLNRCLVDAIRTNVMVYINKEQISLYVRVTFTRADFNHGSALPCPYCSFTVDACYYKRKGGVHPIG